MTASALLLLAIIPGLAAAQPADDRTPVHLPELEVHRLQGEIEIDGYVEDSGWRGAAMASNFAEHNPGDQTIPEVDTDVFITYDDDNLYIAWICYDDPAEVRATYCERDNIFNDDYVILALDTYGEGAMAYEISANPVGVQGDLFYSSAGEDSSYEMVFYSAGRITDEGYVVEMAIPFKELRFPRQENQVWKADFWRNRPRESRFQYSWAAYDRDESCWPCQWGTLRGVTGIEPGKGFEILPSLVTFQDGALGSDGEFENKPITWENAEVGLGISYDLSSEFTAEATLNPDFSQIESDAAQIDINSTFALYYPEKRPFFQEGSDLFNTYFNAVYTRSINDPSIAAKVTGRTGKSSLAFLSAVDEHSVITLPFEETSRNVLNGQSTSNLLRYRRDFGEQTYLGVVATDRRFHNGGSGSLVGLDGMYRLTANDAVEFQVLATNTYEVDDPSLTEDQHLPETFDNDQYTTALDGEKFWGHGIYGSYERETSNFWLDLDYWERSPTFRADSGFEQSNDQRMSFGNAGYHIRFDDSPTLERITPSLNLGRKWNWDGTKKDEWYDANLSVNLRAAQTSFHARVMQSNELFRQTQFDGIWVAHICGSTKPTGSLSMGGNYDYGHRIAREHLVMGKETVFGVWADVKLWDRLLVETRFAKATSKSVDTGVDLYSDNILRSRFGYQFSREFSARLIIEFRDRWLLDRGYRRTWAADPLLTYQINPFSTFFLGSTRSYFDLNLGVHGIDGWSLTHRTYFMKLQYLFQL